MSDGVIRDGTWDNLPPGEVYVVPRDGEGQVAINGSLPGKLLAQGEDLILTFREGRLAEMGPENGPAARHLRATQIAYAERRDDANWPNLAEIGFGLNPAIHDLTGVGTWKKKAHTLHVGLGHSVSLGGDVDSVVHCDMSQALTVYVSGQLILKRGDWRVNETDWRLDHRNVTAPSGWWRASRRCVAAVSALRATRAAGAACGTLAAGGGIRCRSATRRPPAWPRGSTICCPSTAAPWARMMSWRWAARAGAPPSIVPALLWVMHRYDLVRF